MIARRTTLVVPRRIHEHLKAHLFPGDGLEAAALLLCARVGERRQKLIVREVVLVPHEACTHRAADALRWPGIYVEDAIDRAEAEKMAPLSARGNFYRAVILASLATRGKTTNQGQLREARRFYTLAAQQPDAFKGDLRYVSPRILELLRGS